MPGTRQNSRESDDAHSVMVSVGVVGGVVSGVGGASGSAVGAGGASGVGVGADTTEFSDDATGA